MEEGVKISKLRQTQDDTPYIPRESKQEQLLLTSSKVIQQLPHPDQDSFHLSREHKAGNTSHHDASGLSGERRAKPALSLFLQSMTEILALGSILPALTHELLFSEIQCVSTWKPFEVDLNLLVWNVWWRLCNVSGEQGGT